MPEYTAEMKQYYIDLVNRINEQGHDLEEAFLTCRDGLHFDVSLFTNIMLVHQGFIQAVKHLRHPSLTGLEVQKRIEDYCGVKIESFDHSDTPD